MYWLTTRNNNFLVLLFLFSSSFMHSQNETTSTFKARFLYNNQVYKKTLGGRISNLQNFVLDSNGEIDLEIITASDQITMTLNNPKLKIVSPAGGNFPASSKDGFVWDVHLTDAVNQQTELNQILNKFNSSITKVGSSNVAAIKNELNAILSEYNKSTDQKYQDILQQQLAVYEQVELLKEENRKKKALLQEEAIMKKQTNQRIVKNKLTSGLNNYVILTKDLRDLFEGLKAQKVLNDYRKKQDISKTITDYNTAFQELNAMRQEVIDGAGNYWDELTGEKVRGLMRDALDVTHDLEILKQNKLLRQLEELESLRGSKYKRQRDLIDNNIVQAHYNLSKKIEHLEKNKERIFELLK